MKSRTTIVIPVILSCVFVFALVIIVRWFNFEDVLLSLIQRAETAGAIGQWIIIALGAVSVIAILPSVVLTLAAGFLYGAVLGSLLIVVGETIGAVVAFGISRTGIIQAWSTRLRNGGSFKLINQIMQTGGWELVAAIRMIPFFPFKLSNYVFGLSPVRLQHYIVGTLIGLWPITLFNTYLGSMAGDLMSLGTTERERTITEWFILVCGFVVVVVFMLYAIKRAQRLLRETQLNGDS